MQDGSDAVAEIGLDYREKALLIQGKVPAVDAMMSAEKLGIYAQTHLSDAQALLERAREGDEEAFSLLFERYGNIIFNFIYRLVGQREVVEDLTQETFIRAYRKLNSLRIQDDAQLSTWLFGIAKNVARESFRSRRNDQKRIALEDISTLASSEHDRQPDKQLWDKEINHIVQRALETLDNDKRLVFTLRVFHQQSYEEIATITGFSLPKLKADLYRARIQMRGLLRPYLEENHEL